MMGYRDEDQMMRMYEEKIGGLPPLRPMAAPRDPAIEEPAYDPLATVEASQPAESDPVVKEYIAKKYGFSSSNDDAALARAEERAARTRSLAGYGEAFDQIGHAIAGSKQDPSFYREMSKGADAPVETVLRARKGETENMLMKKAGEENDADGALAGNLRKTYGATLKKIGGDTSILDGMSASQIKEYGAAPISEQVKISLAEQAARAKLNAAAALGSKTNTPQQRRANAYVDSKGAAAANDLHNDGNIKKIASLYQNVARGTHNVTPTMTYQVAHEVLQDYAAALSGMNATTDTRIASISPQLFDEKMSNLKTMLTSNPNRPIDGEYYKFLMDQGARLKDAFQNSLSSEVTRKSMGKKYTTPEMQQAFEGARDGYLNGDYFRATDESFATTKNAKYDDKKNSGSGNKPKTKTVEQEGRTYTLNPETGEYE